MPVAQPAGRMRPSLDFGCSKWILYTVNLSLFFDNLEFDIFDAVGFQCHFITSVTNLEFDIFDAVGFQCHFITSVTLYHICYQ